MMFKVLVVDDDINICELISLYLKKEEFEVVLAHTGNKAMELFARENPDIVILDLMLPGIDGLQVCRNIRNISKTPIIMLTAKGETIDKILGLEIGADDYICKPFDPKELVARIKAVLRRIEVKNENTSLVEYENFKIDLANYYLEINGALLNIPPKEFEVLYFLAANPNKVFSRDQLLNEVWGFDFFGDTRTVDVHIKRIREKIEGISNKWQLKTVWGVGYKFEVISFEKNDIL